MSIWTEFRYEALPMRVRFGAGTFARLPDEARDLGLERILVISTPGRAALASTAAAAASMTSTSSG